MLNHELLHLGHYTCEKRWRLFLRTFLEVNVDVSVNEAKAIIYYYYYYGNNYNIY
jgi:hypothetical protein